MARVTRGSSQFQMERARRIKKLEALRSIFPTRIDFVNFVLHRLEGWSMTTIQEEMMEWQSGLEENSMLQMPRGEGKTTLQAISAIYDLILDVTSRIVIFSGGRDLAEEISGYIRQIMYGIDELSFLCPSPELDDPSGRAKFTVSGYLRGVDKSPSIWARTILGGFAGIRADKILCDDLERERASSSNVRREELSAAIKSLTPLLDGSKPGQVIRIIGTPQGEDSVYNDLPAYGYEMRVWPARVPNQRDYEFYKEILAPSVNQRYLENPETRTGFGLDGTLGAIVDPERYTEQFLIKQEQTMGSASFNLQYMLNTKVSDRERYPLKLDKLLFMELDQLEAPVTINTLRSEATQITKPVGFSVPMAKLHEVGECPTERQEYTSCTIYIDPAGGGTVSQDEVAVSVVLELNGYVFVDRVEGYLGGFSDENLDKLCSIIETYWVRGIPLAVYVEENYGNGMFRKLLEGKLVAQNVRVGLEADRVTGQKEKRIIDIMLPLLSSNRLILNKQLIQRDTQSLRGYPAQTHNSYSLFHQIRYLTNERGCLRHDDRLDSLAGALKFYSDALVRDQHKHREEMDKQRRIEEIRNNFGNNADIVLRNLGYLAANTGGRSHTSFGAFRNKKENNYVKEENFKSPAEKLRWQNEEHRKAQLDREGKSKSRRGTGSKASGYFRRK